MVSRVPGCHLAQLATGLVCAISLWAGGSFAGEGHLLPFRLLVVNYDDKLGSFLLSGEFVNELGRPLNALRAMLTLTNSASDETAVFPIDCGLRYPVPPQHAGVCSVWVDYDPEDPDHVTLRRQSAEDLQADFRVLRVLYADRTEEAF